MKLTLAILLFLAPHLHAQAPDRCPMVLTMDTHGRITENRMHGSGYRVSHATLLSDLQGGCKEAGPISSITLHAGPNVQYGKVKALIDFLHQAAPDVPFTLIDPKAKP